MPPVQQEQQKFNDNRTYNLALGDAYTNRIKALNTDGRINLEIALYGLDSLNVDKNGLDDMDNRILLAIIDKFKGGPVGLTTIATAVSEQAGTIEEVYEPFLIKEGFLMRTPRGREATERAYKHLGRVKGPDQGQLF